MLKKYKGKGIDEETEEKRFRFDWEGGLSEISERFDSVGLQHKVLEWR